jgi:hypothetical protein
MVRESNDLKLELLLKARASVLPKETLMDLASEDYLELLTEAKWENDMAPNLGLLTEAKLLKHSWEISLEMLTVGMLDHPSELILKAQKSVLSKVHSSKVSEMEYLMAQKLSVGLWGVSTAAWKVLHLELKMVDLSEAKKAADWVPKKDA